MNWKRLLKRFGQGLAALVALVLVAGVYLLWSFERAAAEPRHVELPEIATSSDPAVLERGRHLAESIGGCLGCHGPDLGGALVEDVGPIGAIRAPNLTRGAGGVGGAYSDGELARAIRYGIGADGQSLLYMPTPEHNWWPDEDVAAVVSFVRSMPPVSSTIEPAVVRPLGKVLNQLGVMQLLSAETVDPTAPREGTPSPAPTAGYGSFLARGCVGCHGERLSGGRIPGAPSSLPIPANLTPHETGLGTWTKEEFVQVLNTGVRRDGRRLDPFMPIASTRAMDETEKGALWAYLRSVEPVEFGER